MPQGYRKQFEGFTLVELVIAIAVISIAFVGILGALGTAVASASLQTDNSTMDTVLRSYAEHIKDEAYQSCADLNDDYGGFVHPALADGFEAKLLAIKYWDGDSPVEFDVDCPPDAGLQLIEIRVEKIGSSPPIVRSSTLVKRNNDN